MIRAFAATGNMAAAWQFLTCANAEGSTLRGRPKSEIILMPNRELFTIRRSRQAAALPADSPAARFLLRLPARRGVLTAAHNPSRDTRGGMDHQADGKKPPHQAC
ncbi:hypothetical protein Q9295_00815 [Xinfangfangia sp. CPCC 101601]|uniref:Uncharacterized protein n=1 Tax=Pseudogemmobacter lacusdianii TaxID=3069608 RepID=A0ABU0VUG4_9RHOB|nr:hypothetical protein [Xinfangfangia sp. CPCC 101601]MDQ2064900.1 hypothetical protein [Xinfangfangia sp. CPCC 101601]